MGIVEFYGGRITHKDLRGKTTHEMASFAMDHLRAQWNMIDALREEKVMLEKEIENQRKMHVNMRDFFNAELEKLKS